MSHKQTCMACLDSIYRSCWFSLQKQAVLYSIISTNTPKINHSLSKAFVNNWDLTAISSELALEGHWAIGVKYRQASLSGYSLDAFVKCYQVTDKS